MASNRQMTDEERAIRGLEMELNDMETTLTNQQTIGEEIVQTQINHQSLDNQQPQVDVNNNEFNQEQPVTVNKRVPLSGINNNRVLPSSMDVRIEYTNDHMISADALAEAIDTQFPTNEELVAAQSIFLLHSQSQTANIIESTSGNGEYEETLNQVNINDGEAAQDSPTIVNENDLNQPELPDDNDIKELHELVNNLGDNN